MTKAKSKLAKILCCFISSYIILHGWITIVHTQERGWDNGSSIKSCAKIHINGTQISKYEA